MAKVSLSKITPIKSGEVKEIEFKGEKIQVRQYLSTNDKIALTERVLSQAFDDSNHYSIFRLEILSEIEILKAYTNLNITDKQMEDIPHLYDILKLNRVFDLLNYIPENELNELHNKIHNEAVNLDQYLNSLMGIMKTITTDYSNTEMKVDELTDKLNDPKAFETVKEILNKIG